MIKNQKLQYKVGYSYLMKELDYGNKLACMINDYTQLTECSFEYSAFLEDSPTIKSEDIIHISNSQPYCPGTYYLADYILGRYGKTKSSIVLMDDVMLSPKETHSQGIKINPISINKEVFWWGKLGSFTGDNLRDTIYATNLSWHFLCVILTPKHSLTLLNDLSIKNVLEGDTKDFNILEVIVGAFDGEGFLHCVNEKIKGNK